MELLALAAFTVILMICIITNVSVIYAMITGYVIFWIYAKIKGFSAKEIFRMSGKGIITVKKILLIFLLIGIITALWRAGGTIPAIVYYSAGLLSPGVFVLLTFLLNCLVSVLSGTAFGTSATMGAVCMTMASSLNINPAVVGGAVLAGAYFGDRCSPVSTSALLVAELTKTNIYDNIKAMIKTAAVPFFISCIVYLVIGLGIPKTAIGATNICELFSENFNIVPLTLVPAILILVLSCFKVRVKTSMLLSIASAVVVCIFCQNIPFYKILYYSVFGFSVANEELSAVISGGGIVSMLRVTGIVCISSCYSGIFNETGFLEGIKSFIAKMKQHITPYAAVLITSVVTNIFACNQTLAIMLTEQLCGDTDKRKTAIYIENSAVVIAPLVPWSVAASVSLTSAGAPAASALYAVFLYLLPIYGLIIHKNEVLK